MIHRVRVANFKSIRSVTVNLSPVTVLVGKSGSGKSNFVESIRCLRDIFGARKRGLTFTRFGSSCSQLGVKTW